MTIKKSSLMHVKFKCTSVFFEESISCTLGLNGMIFGGWRGFGQSISRANAWDFQTEGGPYPRKMELQEEPICLHMQNLHRMKFSELIFIITCLWKNGNFSIKAKGVPLWKYWKNHCFFGIESYNWN